MIDSHVHFWNPRALRYEWLDAIPALNRPFTPEDYRQAVGSGEPPGVVFVQADCAPDQALDEARWAAALGAPVAGIVAFAPLEQPDPRPTLDALAGMPLVKGVRRLIQSEPSGFATQPAFVAGVRLLAEYDFAFDLCVYARQLADVITLVRQCPNVRFVLDHLGKPDIAGGEIDGWRAAIHALAQSENVSAKLSGLVSEADPQRWTPADLRPYVEAAFDAFGADRLMFGSDWPVCTQAASYARWLETLNQLLGALSASEKRQLFSENAARFYRLDSGETAL